MQLHEIIKLNVGGCKYETSLNTLTSDTNSMLANMFSGRHLVKPNDKGYYFIDRDGDIFKYIIKYLRDKKLNIDKIDISIVENIKDEAEYFQIEGLIELCNKKISGLELNPETKYIFDEIIKFDIKAFEKDFNEVFSVNKLSNYPYEQVYGYLKLDETPEDIIKNTGKYNDYIVIFIDLKKIFEHIEHYEAIRLFSQKWTALFPETYYRNNHIEQFNRVVRIAQFISPYFKIFLKYLSSYG
jgi:hypothetical protein